MRIGIPRETREGETRVAATPETVKKYVAGKHQVMVERGAGLDAVVGIALGGIVDVAAGVANVLAHGVFLVRKRGLTGGNRIAGWRR